MSARGLAWIARARLRADRRRVLLDAAAASVGGAALVFFLALGLGVSAAARRMFPADARLVEVIPPAVSLGGILGGGPLDDRAVARLAEIPGVSAAWPGLMRRVPVAAPEAPPGLASSWPPGMTLQIPVMGLSPEMVAEDVGEGERFEDPGPGGKIPVLLSRRLEDTPPQPPYPLLLLRLGVGEADLRDLELLDADDPRFLVDEHPGVEPEDAKDRRAFPRLP